MASESNLNRYKDLDLNFIAHPTTGDVVQKIGLDAIKRSVRNLIYTRKNEKPFQPDIHSKIRNLLFEPATPLVKIELRKSIENVLRTHEPRIKLLDVRISASPDQNTYNVTITYRVENFPEPQNISVQLERLR
tara:strand:+ start:363 stop:761 length:399 start_codon:yes stop_codon:yes gene_type:complete